MLQRCHPGYKTKCLVITESVIDSTYSAACQCNFGDFVSFGSDCRHREHASNTSLECTLQHFFTNSKEEGCRALTKALFCPWIMLVAALPP